MSCLQFIGSVASTAQNDTTSETDEVFIDDEPLPALPQLSAIEEVVSDYRTAGL